MRGTGLLIQDCRSVCASLLVHGVQCVSKAAVMCACHCLCVLCAASASSSESESSDEYGQYTVYSHSFCTGHSEH